ncbi:tripeptidyl-peptidase 1 precursor [Microthyrium microscopicum]|uniref:tripeptidyl-peptidase II n=1 Tax=Microthyrium microscopicum TaxID=703497 RepID=A0A6A6UVH4_9PEZI|nr:tripeptidyl-peptidase 1 precursor [Microthyrium microscopicum]
MLGSWQLTFFALVVDLVSGTPVQATSAYTIRERHTLPRGWKSHLQLQIGVKQSRFDELERHLYEVSDPEHARYGQHLSSKEVTELIKPTKESLDLVYAWLKQSGISTEQLEHSPAKDWIRVSLPLKDVENLLQTKYSAYEHEDGTRLARTLGWSLPQHLHAHIDTIQPTTSFLRYKPRKSNTIGFGVEAQIPEGYVPPSDPTLSKVCNITLVTPQCFQALYKTANYEVQSDDENSIGFNNFLGEIPIRPDALEFVNKYRKDALEQANSFPQISIDGGPTQDGPLTYAQALTGISQEANLDVQAILGISSPTPVIAYSTGGEPPFIPGPLSTTNTNEPYLTWINYVLDKDDTPPVVSTSYGDDEQSVPLDYAMRVCRGFAQLGARGISLLVASGDDGVGPNGKRCKLQNTNTTGFLPGFPATCPYVTAVGATHQFQPEVAAFSGSLDANGNPIGGVYSSGGGFSNYFPKPMYQVDAVHKYIEGLGGKFNGLYNKSGRAFPDISAQGQNFAIFWNGTEERISGTSASTPLFSGIIALVNDALIAAGKPTLGFLNPWLYKKGHFGFTDITGGSAVGCDSPGFPAVKGWDAVTGFGTPVFPALVKLTGGELDKKRHK